MDMAFPYSCQGLAKRLRMAWLLLQLQAFCFLMWKNASFCDFIVVFGTIYGTSGWQSRKSQAKFVNKSKKFAVFCSCLTFFYYLCLRIAYLRTRFARILQGKDTKTYLLNIPLEPLLRKGFNEQFLFVLKLRSKRRLLHNELEAVAGLSGNMAGLRFSYVRKWAWQCWRNYSINLKAKEQIWMYRLRSTT